MIVINECLFLKIYGMILICDVDNNESEIVIVRFLFSFFLSDQNLSLERWCFQMKTSFI